MVVKLNSATLGMISGDVGKPAYDRDAVRPGIAHIGVGGFHRSHEAMYVNRLLSESDQAGWAIAGIGVLPSDRSMRDVLGAQDNLYTLATRAPDGSSEAQIIGSIVDYRYVPDDPTGALRLLTSDAIKFVSLTITEGGYRINDETGEFDSTGRDVVEDLARADGPPATVFGLITEALRRRRALGIKPFTVLSCDNIEDNGGVARRSFTAFAALKDPELAEWMKENVSFPSSMVDRITPATTAQSREFVERSYGIDDGWPVVSESFVQWVVEDRFTLGRPALERVGVQLVDDVRPYEAMKLRLLNASHQAMSYLGILAGHTYVHEAVNDPDISAFVLGYMTDEATPTLAPVPGVDLGQYRQDLLSRFSNPAIIDTLARQVVDGSERIAKFLLPVARERLLADKPVDHIALVIAAWAEYIRQTTRSSGLDALHDSRAAELVRASEGEAAGRIILDLPLFGTIGQNPDFVAAYRIARSRLLADGPIPAIRALTRVDR